MKRTPTSTSHSHHLISCTSIPRERAFDRALFAIERKSVFGFSESDGTVFERFWVDNRWSVLNHGSTHLDEGEENVAVSVHSNRLYVVTSTGRLFVRGQHHDGSALRWELRSPPPPFRLRGHPRSNMRGSLFFIASDGTFLECRDGIGTNQGESWHNHGRPASACLASIADPARMDEDSVFVVTGDGRLFQKSLSRGTWTEYDRPSDAFALAPVSGLFVRAAAHYSSLFLKTVWGEVVELRWSSPRKWRWRFYGRPNGTAVASPPVASCFSNSIFVVGDDGEAYELRDVDTEQWRWIDHGTPGNIPARRSGPVVFDNRRLFFSREDGYIAERHFDGKWHWSIHGAVGRGRKPS